MVYRKSAAGGGEAQAGGGAFGEGEQIPIAGKIGRDEPPAVQFDRIIGEEGQHGDREQMRGAGVRAAKCGQAVVPEHHGKNTGARSPVGGEGKRSGGRNGRGRYDR